VLQRDEESQSVLKTLYIMVKKVKICPNPDVKAVLLSGRVGGDSLGL